MARNHSAGPAVAIAGAMLTSLFGQPARAHIDPAPLLFEKAAAARARLEYETLVAEGRRFEPGASPAPVWDGVWTNRAHRREIRRGDEVDTILTIERRRWRFGDEGHGAPTRIRPDPMQVFVVDATADPNGRRGLALLESYAIDPEVVSMSRQEGRPVYVIGAKPWEPNRPQLWLDAELLTPARLVFVVDGVRHDLRWLGFGSPITGPFYPRSYEERIDEELVLRIEFARVEPNAPIDERRFRAPR
jgi:hypothetical protein